MAAPIDNVAAYDVASFTFEELANYVINLSDNDIYSRGGSRHSQHSQLRMSDFLSLIIPIIMLKVMNELRFKTQDKHIFIYYVFKVFISTPSLYSIYFTPFCLCETFLDLLR